MGEWSELLQSALSALPRAEETVHILSEAGLPRPEWGLLLPAYLCEPPPTFDMLADWVPYASRSLLQTRVDALLAKDFLQEVAPQEYILTDKAVELLQHWAERERAHLARQAPLSRKDLQRLAALLGRVVQAALAAPPPPEKDRLLGSRRIAPAADAAPIVQVDQYLTDLFWFRDDAHVAAWRRQGLSGASIETLTLLWRGEVKDVDGLSVALSERRGHTRDDYAHCVQGLVNRGLVDVSQPELALTSAGRAVREEVEATTESYYMFPWTVLLPVEMKQLRDLLQRFTQAIKKP